MHYVVNYMIYYNWDDLKPKRGIIEDFFKVAIDAFGLGKFHSYTVESMSRNIYFMFIINKSSCTTRFIRLKQHYRDQQRVMLHKTRLLRKNSNKKKKSEDNSNDETDNTQKTGQQLLDIELSNGQTVLVDFTT